jgi:hypothetical protein
MVSCRVFNGIAIALVMKKDLMRQYIAIASIENDFSNVLGFSDGVIVCNTRPWD